MRISMLGPSSAGKTTYMCALLETMVKNNFLDFSLTPYCNQTENSNTLAGVGELESISFLRNGENLQFPIGTNETRNWRFELSYKNTPLFTIDWLDYKGGKVNQMFCAEKDAAEIKKIIYYSNAVMIFIDAIQLALIEDNNICKNATGADKLVLILKDYEKKFRKEKTIVLFVLTKCDSTLIAEEYKKDDYLLLIAKFRYLFKDILAIKAQNLNWRMGIVPITSVGNGNTESRKKKNTSILNPFSVECDLIKYPTPLNVAEAFLFCVKEIVKVSKEFKHDERLGIQKEASFKLDNSSLWNEVISKLTGKESYSSEAKTLTHKRVITESQEKKLTEIVDLLEKCTQLEVVQIL